MHPFLGLMKPLLRLFDDFADDPRIMHSNAGAASGGSMLNTLFIRWHRMGISTLVSSQKLKLAEITQREFNRDSKTTQQAI